MSSTSFSVGIEGKMTSRILKPPGGGHSNIFGPPDDKPRQPRSKHDQQNSEMMSEIMGKKNEPQVVEAKKIAVESFPDPMQSQPAPSEPVQKSPVTSEPPAFVPTQIVEVESSKVEVVTKTDHAMNSKTDECQNKGRIPPGGYSSGLW